MTDAPEPKLEVVAPVLPVRDVEASRSYFVGKLLFELRFEWADAKGEPLRYAVLGRDRVELHLSQRDAPVKTTAYFFVDGVQAFHDRVAKAGARISEPIADHPWEMREFEVRDLDDNALVFGQHLSRIASV